MLVVSSEFHARSLTETDLIDFLMSKFDVEIFTTTIIQEKYFSNVSKNNIRIFSVNKTITIFYMWLMDIGTIKYLSRSKSFGFKLKRVIFGDTFLKNFYGLRKTKKIVGLTYKLFKNFIKLILSLTILYKVLNNIYFKMIIKRFDLAEFQENSFEAIICWAQSIEPSSIAGILLSRRLHIPSILIFDNWDNLSSKTVFPLEPTAVICFGAQSAQFAKKIHGFEEAEIYPIGSARFEAYRNIIERQEKISPNQILYAGSAIAHEDKKLLTFFDEYYSSRNDLPPFKYRRHPYPQSHPEDWNNSYYRHILVEVDKIQQNGLDSLELTRNELKNTKILVAMPTTFLLEGLICGIPTILVSFENESVRPSSRFQMENLEHLKELNRLTGLYIAKDPKELAKLMDEHLKGNYEKIDRSRLQFYVSWSDEPFCNKLVLIINSTINKGS